MGRFVTQRFVQEDTLGRPWWPSGRRPPNAGDTDAAPGWGTKTPNAPGQPGLCTAANTQPPKDDATSLQTPHWTWVINACLYARDGDDPRKVPSSSYPVPAKDASPVQVSLQNVLCRRG